VEVFRDHGVNSQIIFKNAYVGVWCYSPIIPALQRLRQEDPKFEATLGQGSKILFQKTKKERNMQNDRENIATDELLGHSCSFSIN
jgi:hypothetical protein